MDEKSTIGRVLRRNAASHNKNASLFTTKEDTLTNPGKEGWDPRESLQIRKDNPHKSGKKAHTGGKKARTSGKKVHTNENPLIIFSFHDLASGPALPSLNH